MDRLPARTLPPNYTVHDWPVTWGLRHPAGRLHGGDNILTWQHRQVSRRAALFTTGILLVCDAWFDVTTAGDADFAVTLLTAFLGCLLAAILIVGS